MVISFCYYLAEIHLKVKDEEDYKKIFFIIDDPISSLDENYIYSISEIIRKLGNDDKLFDIKKIEHKKFIILTHNLLFYLFCIEIKYVIILFK